MYDGLANYAVKVRLHISRSDTQLLKLPKLVACIAASHMLLLPGQQHFVPTALVAPSVEGCREQKARLKAARCPVSFANMPCLCACMCVFTAP